MPPPTVKQNTVDIIVSNVSNETAMPVTVLDDPTPLLSKCRPYEIIYGRNPFDETECPPEAVVGAASSGLSFVRKSETGVSTTTKVKEEVEAESAPQPQLTIPPPLGSTPTGRPARKRERSPVITRKRRQQVEEEEKGEEAARQQQKQRQRGKSEKTGATSPAFPSATVSATNDSLPAEFFTSTVSPSPIHDFLQRPHRDGWAQGRLADSTPYAQLQSMDMETKLQYVLDDEDYKWCGRTGVSPLSLQRGITYLEWAYVSYVLQATDSNVRFGARHGLYGSSTTPPPQSPAESADSSLTFATTTTAMTVTSPTSGARRGSGAGGGAETQVLCTVCCKPVEIVTLSGSDDDGDGPISVEADSAFGLRCATCHVVAHLQCWYLTEGPRHHPDAWQCDACYAAAQHARKITTRCVVCARSGGALLPYRSSQREWMVEETEGGALSSPARLPPFLSAASLTASPGSPTTVAAGAEPMCHVVCALAFPELSVRVCPTRYRRNGMVDMTARPYIVANRRIQKQRHSLNCVFCQHEMGSCVQCQHPKCFETMHPSCAAQARTIECFHEDFASPSSLKRDAVDASTEEPGTGGKRAAQKNLPEGSLGLTPNQDESSYALYCFWAGCSTYCRRHFGFSVHNSVGSSALSHQAERDALTLDLTGFLTGPQEVDFRRVPMNTKRPRGRPPVALVQQREAERVLLAKIKFHWQDRRHRRRQESASWVQEINVARSRPILSAALRPELVKISSTKVRLSHFLCLIPEWQQLLVHAVEGELPLPDEEYEDVQRYRKVSHTRRGGNTQSVYDKLVGVRRNLHLLHYVATLLREGARCRRALVEKDVEQLELLCQWGQ